MSSAYSKPVYDSTAFLQALGQSEMGWSVFPVPHGWDEPLFDYTRFLGKSPDFAQIQAWFKKGGGLGVVLGEASCNLAAIEFRHNDAYRMWRCIRPDLAATLPRFQLGNATYVVFHTPEPVKSAKFRVAEGDPDFDEYLPAKLLGEGEFLALPPTKDHNGVKRSWVTEPRMPMSLLTLEEAGVTSPRELTLQDEPPEVVDEDVAKAFQSLPDYIAAQEATELKWVVEGFLPETYLVVLAASSKSGKSCLATHLAMCVSNGTPFLGMDTAEAGVLWVAYEESAAERTQSLLPYLAGSPDFSRLQEQGVEAGQIPNTEYPIPNTDPPTPNPLPPTLQSYNPLVPPLQGIPNLFITHSKFLIDQPRGLGALRHWVRKTNAKLIVIDPLYAATAADTLMDGRKAREALAGLKELCRTENCAAIVLHHFTKDQSAGVSRERIAESGQLLAVASMDIRMEFSVLTDGTREIWLRGQGRGEFANQTWRIRSRSASEYELLASGADALVKRNRVDEAILEFLASTSEPQTSEQIAEGTGVNRNTVRNRLPGLQERGKIGIVGKLVNRALYGVAH